MQQNKKSQKNYITLFDTTLRDGQQTPGIDFSLSDKIWVANTLDQFGIDYIEGGYPGANQIDTQFFKNPPKLKNAKLTAFGMVKRAGRSIQNDPGLQAILKSGAKHICFVAKTWDYHVKRALNIEMDENLKLISQTINEAVKQNINILLDCEHFFDGYKANPQYALKCAQTALDAGAKSIVLCDTNGGTMPHEIGEIIRQITKKIPNENIGIHAHNDTGQAIANSLTAIKAGARHIQGTINGIGERCGNANLITIIPTLILKNAWNKDFEIGIKPENLKNLKKIADSFDERLNRAPNRQYPYVGKNAFATKAGIHASAILKEPETYEHIKPEYVGNQREILTSSQAGKTHLMRQMEKFNIKIDPDDPKINQLLQTVKKHEAEGYAYESAGASFELLVRRIFQSIPAFFHVIDFRVISEIQAENNGSLNSKSQAIVKINVQGETRISAGEGNGPVNALDMALRKDLGKYSPYLEDLKLTDYKVRILDDSTAAITRVLVESADKYNHRWRTVGVSANIVDASFNALVDSITYKLLKENAPHS